MIAAAVRLSYDRYFEIIDWFLRTSAGSPYEIVKSYDSCKVRDQVLDMSTFFAVFARFQKPKDSRNATARQTHENPILISWLDLSIKCCHAKFTKLS